ncbi:MAG: hypothetical protein ACE5JX_06625 [Acidobacteriota bacterium]
MALTLRGNYADLANGFRGLTILDVSEPANPVEVASLDTGEPDALAVDVVGPFAYVADASVMGR